MQSNNKIQPKILVTGSTGLVGSRFIQLVKNHFSITTLGRNNVDVKINLLSYQEIKGFIQQSDAQIVVNFAAYTNVDEAEKEKGDKKGEVFALNALLPFWLARICKSSRKRLCHISTDYVFDGKQENRPYTEDDLPSPVNSWYSITKSMGETKVKEGFANLQRYIIARISYPYSGVYERKLDFARLIFERLRQKQSYYGITDQKIKPTSVDDISQAILFLLEKGTNGIYHVAGNYPPKDFITPYHFALKLADQFQFGHSLIKPISFLRFSKKRLVPRPQHTWLDTKKIENLGFSSTNIDSAMWRFKQQLIDR